MYLRFHLFHLGSRKRHAETPVTMKDFKCVNCGDLTDDAHLWWGFKLCPQCENGFGDLLLMKRWLEYRSTSEGKLFKKDEKNCCPKCKDKPNLVYCGHCRQPNQLPPASHTERCYNCNGLPTRRHIDRLNLALCFDCITTWEKNDRMAAWLSLAQTAAVHGVEVVDSQRETNCAACRGYPKRPIFCVHCSLDRDFVDTCTYITQENIRLAKDKAQYPHKQVEVFGTAMCDKCNADTGVQPRRYTDRLYCVKCQLDTGREKPAEDWINRSHTCKICAGRFAPVHIAPDEYRCFKCCENAGLKVTSKIDGDGLYKIV